MALIVSIAMFIFALDTTMMNVAITALAQDLDTAIQNIQFAIACYALIIAAVMMLGAKLAKIYGIKRIFLLGVILYGIGTLTASLSVNIAMLTLGWSVIEGVGAAFMVPTSAAFLIRNYEGKERAVAFAIFTSTTVGAAATGPIIGGAFTTYLSWRGAFAMEFLLVVIILVFSRVLTEYRSPEKPTLDIVGALLSALGFGCLVFGLINTSANSWASVLMITGGIILLLLVIWEIRQERKGNEPLVPTSLLKNRNNMAGGLVNLLQQLCIAALLFTIPFFLQSILSKNAMETGLIVMPMTLSMLVMMLLTPRLGARVPVKYLAIFGIVLTVIGAVLLANSFSADMAITALIPGFVIYGLGLGLALAQLQNLTLSSLKPSVTDEGAGLFNTFRNLGSSLGTAIVGTLLITFFLSGMVLGINNSSVLPQEDKDTLTAVVTQNTVEMTRDEIAAEAKAILDQYPPESAQEIKAIAADAIGHAMRLAYYTIAGILGCSLVASLFLPKRKLIPSADLATGPPT